MKNQAKQIVHLRIYKAKHGLNRISYDENQNIQNENHLVKIQYNSFEWMNFMKNHRSLNLLKMEAEKVLEWNGDGWDEMQSVPEEIVLAVKEAMEGKQEDKPVTEDQKRIQELERKIEELASSKKEEPKDEELIQARRDYFEAFGKKGHHSWSVNQIREKIAEKE